MDILTQTGRKTWETYLCKIIQVKKAVGTKTSRGKPESEAMLSKKARIAQESERGVGGAGGEAMTPAAATGSGNGDVASTGRGKLSDWLGFDAQDNAIQASIDEERTLNTQRHGELLGAVNRLSETLLQIFVGGEGGGGGSGRNGYPPPRHQHYPTHQQQHQQQAFGSSYDVVHQHPAPLANTTYQSPVNGGSSMYVTKSTAAYVSTNSSSSSSAPQRAIFMVGNGPAGVTGDRVQEM